MKSINPLFLALLCALFTPCSLVGQRLSYSDLAHFFPYQENRAASKPVPKPPVPLTYNTQRGMELHFAPAVKEAAWTYREPQLEILRAFENSRVVSFLDQSVELRRLTNLRENISSRRKWDTSHEFGMAVRHVVFDIGRKPIVVVRKLRDTFQ